MHHRRITIISRIFIIIFAVASCGIFLLLKNRDGRRGTENAVSENSAGGGVLTIWYCEEGLKDYIDMAAAAFKENEGINVVAIKKTGLEYLEEIDEASVAGSPIMPDLYIIGADMLEKAALMGLADSISDPDGVVGIFNYPENAINAITCNGRRVAYPFYYETAFLLYNYSYLNEIAEEALRMDMTEENTENEEAAVIDGIPEGYDVESWDAAVKEKALSMVPSSVQDIMDMAALYSAPEGMENVFLWDVSDIFYNYFFTGAYMDVGGLTGDDAQSIDICNEETISCMQVYQSLHDFFSIDQKSSSYEEVINEFLDGKTLFTIATTDALKKIKDKADAGEFPYVYGVAALPGADAEHEARGLSNTSSVAVNPYSADRRSAELFAEYLVGREAESLYELTGKLPCINGAWETEQRDARTEVRKVYSESASLPKLMKLADFWIRLEQAYNAVWDGADPEETLSGLEEEMKKRF